jgi:hypothetical protein
VVHIDVAKLILVGTAGQTNLVEVIVRTLGGPSLRNLVSPRFVEVASALDPAVLREVRAQLIDVEVIEFPAAISIPVSVAVSISIPVSVAVSISIPVSITISVSVSVSVPVSVSITVSISITITITITVPSVGLRARIFARVRVRVVA